MKNNYYEVRGTVVSVSPVETYQTRSGETRLRRSIVLDVTPTDITGERIGYPNTPQFEFDGEKAVSRLQHLQSGQPVSVTFTLRGSRYTRRSDGQEAIFTRIEAFTITPYKTTGQPINATT